MKNLIIIVLILALVTVAGSWYFTSLEPAKKQVPPPDHIGGFRLGEIFLGRDDFYGPTLMDNYRGQGETIYVYSREWTNKNVYHCFDIKTLKSGQIIEVMLQIGGFPTEYVAELTGSRIEFDELSTGNVAEAVNDALEMYNNITTKKKYQPANNRIPQHRFYYDLGNSYYRIAIEMKGTFSANLVLKKYDIGGAEFILRDWP